VGDRIDSSTAQPARRYNYWLGGKDNFAVDRASGDEILKAFPTARIAALALGAGFVRVSTGSQDGASQVKVIEADAAERGTTIVKWFKLHGYSASHGTREPALREVTADIARGDYSTLIVTESSRLDRREDLDAQAEILLAIPSAGGDIVSIGEPQFGRTDLRVAS
jgi:hypothetical protein